MPRLPPLNPQFKLSKKILHPLLSSNTNTQNLGPAPGRSHTPSAAPIIPCAAARRTLRTVQPATPPLCWTPCMAPHVATAPLRAVRYTTAHRATGAAVLRRNHPRLHRSCTTETCTIGVPSARCCCPSVVPHRHPFLTVAGRTTATANGATPSRTPSPSHRCLQQHRSHAAPPRRHRTTEALTDAITPQYRQQHIPFTPTRAPTRLHTSPTRPPRPNPTSPPAIVPGRPARTKTEPLANHIYIGRTLLPARLH
jgi:hypothetical protein